MKWISLFIILVILFACQTKTQQTASTLPAKASSGKEIVLPSYISNPPTSTDFGYYGTGSGVTDKTAEEAAKTAILHQIRSYINSEFSSVEREIEVNDKSLYNSFIENKIQSFSYGRIPGIQVQAKDKVGDMYYCLAYLERSTFVTSQREIQNRIRELATGMEAKNDAGLQLKRYVLAASELSKVLLPFQIDGEPEYVFFRNKIENILENLRFAVTISDADHLNGKRTIRLQAQSQGAVFSSVSLLLPGATVIPDENGFIYLPFEDYCPDNGNLKIRLKASSIPLAPNLYPEEETYARNLIGNFLHMERAIHIPCPQEYQAWVQVNYLIDGERNDSTEITNRIKEVITSSDNWFLAPRNEANVVIEVDFDVAYLSTNKHLGDCYKSTGIIRFRGEKADGHVIDLRGQNIAEETKVFNKSKQQAILQCQSKLIDKMRTEIGNYIRTMK